MPLSSFFLASRLALHASASLLLHFVLIDLVFYPVQHLVPFNKLPFYWKYSFIFAKNMEASQPRRRGGPACYNCGEGIEKGTFDFFLSVVGAPLFCFFHWFLAKILCPSFLSLFSPSLISFPVPSLHTFFPP